MPTKTYSSIVCNDDKIRSLICHHLMLLLLLLYYTILTKIFIWHTLMLWDMLLRHWRHWRRSSFKGFISLLFLFLLKFFVLYFNLVRAVKLCLQCSQLYHVVFRRRHVYVIPLSVEKIHSIAVYPSIFDAETGIKTYFVQVLIAHFPKVISILVF